LCLNDEVNTVVPATLVIPAHSLKGTRAGIQELILDYLLPKPSVFMSEKIMDRIPEPELMNDAEQAAAYALADFEEPHALFIEKFRASFPEEAMAGTVLDLGCGPGDITIRFVHAYPRCVVHGVDGAAAMLAHGRSRVEEEELGERTRLIEGYLPGAELPLDSYDVVISNSLLHHLRDPMVLWDTVKQYGKSGAAVFIMDLRRPASRGQAAALVDEYAAGEPDILRHDFFHSLLAAYHPDEVSAQLRAAGLDGLRVRMISDRHLLIYGRLP
jgi:SAM-dependent methyltransferase